MPAPKKISLILQPVVIVLKRFFTFTGWRQFFRILTEKEKNIFLIFLILALNSLIFLGLNFYFKNSEIQPAFGGRYIEGVVGSPRFINPIYGTTSDTDRDLIELLFSGLMRYDIEGRIVPDLAKSYEIKESGRVYEIDLKEELFWSDGSPLSVNDIIFTIKIIQNQDYKSPLRASWLGVEVEKISDLKVRFTLKNPYYPFLENLTLKLIPEKIWQEISPQNFALTIYNLKPVGSGSYKLKNLRQDRLGNIKSLTLLPNPYYHGKRPFLSEITFLFFEKEEDLIKAARKKEIQGFTLASIKNLPQPESTFNLYSFSLPRYFAVFFNSEKAKIFKEKEVRLALNYGTNKEEIVQKFFDGQAKVAYSPLLPEIFGFQEPSKIYQFNLEKAREILDEAGFRETEGQRVKTIKKTVAFQFKSDLKLGSRGSEVSELQRCLANPPAGGPEIYPEAEVSGYFGEKTREAVIRFQEKYKKEILDPWGFERGTGLVSKTTRAKLNEICFPAPEEKLELKFSLATIDQAPLKEVAIFLKNEWEKLGVKVKIETFDISKLSQEIIKPRDYESLLFGEVLGALPDPFPFWHSIQKRDPGLNLALYENKKVDQLLEKARQSQSFSENKEYLENFQDILLEDSPVIFLYRPDFLYFNLSREIKGIEPGLIADPSKRFAGIENWYLKTERVWKKD